jgi:hypothetical protein
LDESSKKYFQIVAFDSIFIVVQNNLTGLQEAASSSGIPKKYLSKNKLP